MSERVTIGSGKLTASIDTLGAELISLTDAQGRQYMTDADPAFWTGHAPILFPVIGELAGGAYRLGDRSYDLPRHGFARRSSFACAAHEEGSVRLRLEDNGATRAVYPFAFALELHFALRGMTLAMTATITNRGAEPMPFSFGYHPAFAWPLPGGGEKLAHAIVFERPEPQMIRRLDAKGLLALTEPTPVDGRTLHLDPALFEADAMIWDRLASRSLSYGAPGSARLDIAFPDTTMLGIWQKPGANFICIEPWAGIADPAGFAGDFRDKPGIMELAPGAERSLRMDVTVVPA